MLTRTGQSSTNGRTHRWARRGAVAASLLALSVSLTGCFSSGYRYISHRDADGTLLGFKIPSNWTTYDTKQVLEAANGPISNSESAAIADGQWITVFSASSHSSPNFFKVAETSNYPIGIVSVRPLTETERDGFNYGSLRAELLGTDPLAASSPDPYNVTAYNEFLGGNGLRGSKLTTNIKLGSGATATLSQIVEVDPDTNWVFALGIGCKASCYGPNSGVIKQVLDSWALKEVKS